MKTIKLTATTAGERLDAYIAASELGLTRSAAARLAEEGCASVGGMAVRKNYRVNIGDIIEITLSDPIPDAAEAEDIRLDIVFEDEDIIVINKPSGMVVHPAAGNYNGTLVNALLHHCGSSLSGIGGVVRPGIVHRIDKDTAGLLVAAKNDAAHASLAAQLGRHDVKRIYHALTVGMFREESGTIDAPLGRDPKNRKRMAVIHDPTKKARSAVTHWRLLERFEGFSYVVCELETGRTHQIRVHMASVGHPLMGDAVYGGGKSKFERQNKELIHGQCLFAKELELTHPRSGETMRFAVELPGDIAALIEKLRKTGQ